MQRGTQPWLYYFLLVPLSGADHRPSNCAAGQEAEEAWQAEGCRQRSGQRAAGDEGQPRGAKRPPGRPEAGQAGTFPAVAMSRANP